MSLVVWVDGHRISLGYNSGNPGTVKHFLVVLKPTAQVGEGCFISLCFTWWGEDKLRHQQRLKIIKVSHNLLKRSNKKYTEKSKVGDLGFA